VGSRAGTGMYIEYMRIQTTGDGGESCAEQQPAPPTPHHGAQIF
jgi:hypothetical protein